MLSRARPLQAANPLPAKPAHALAHALDARAAVAAHLRCLATALRQDLHRAVVRWRHNDAIMAQGGRVVASPCPVCVFVVVQGIVMAAKRVLATPLLA